MKNFCFFILTATIMFFSCGNNSQSFIHSSDSNDDYIDAPSSDEDELNDNSEDSDHDFTDEEIVDNEVVDDSVADADQEESSDNSLPPIPMCGNGRIEGDEFCDGNSIDCTEIGYISGVAECNSDCSDWNTSTCEKECKEGVKRCEGRVVIECVSGNFQEIEDCSEKEEKCRSGRCIDPDESDPRLDFEGPDFSGDTILVYHYSADGDSTQSSGTLGTSPPFSPSSKAYDIPSEILMIDRRPPLPDNLGLPAVALEKIFYLHEPVKSFELGDKDTFYVYDFDSSSNREAEATLRKRGTYCEVWVEDEGAFVSDDKVQSIVNEFDTVIYPLVTDNFYDVADVDENGFVSIFLTDLKGGAGGYITMGDFYTKSEYPESNFRDLVYIEKDRTTSEINSVIVHEFQHLVHANRNLLVEEDESVLNDLSYRWIDEGLATAAQHMYEGAQNTWLYIMNNAPYNESVRDGNSFLFWDYYDNEKVYSDYAMAYVFIQYLRIQSGNDTSIYREIIECQKNDNSCIEKIVLDYVDSEYTLSDFIVDFKIALLFQDSSGPYGFGGESEFDFSIPSFTGDQVNLRGGGGVYINNPGGSFSRPADAGSDIIFVGIDTN